MIINKDCLEALKELPDNSIDSIVTDPPYGLSFMGKKWDYDVPSTEIWSECLRVLKPGGYLLAFAGTRTQHRMAVRIEDAGFEIRDMIAWIYGSGFPKSLNIGKAVDKLQGNEREQLGDIKPAGFKTAASGYTDNKAWSGKVTKGTSEWEGWGTALKPALEPITVARKPIEGTVAENCLKWGVGGINIDGSRVEGQDKKTPKTRAYSKGQFGGTEGKGVEGMVITQVEHIDGRFPANLIHDGSEEVLELFPETKSGALKSTQYEFPSGNNDSMFAGDGKFSNKGYGSDSGSAARFFYCAKASKSERGTDNKHPTVKPLKLMEYLVNLVSKEGHTVLDPFAGSGTTGIACKKLNRNFIGIERDEEYCKIAEARINNLTLN